MLLSFFMILKVFGLQSASWSELSKSHATQPSWLHSRVIELGTGPIFKSLSKKKKVENRWNKIGKQGIKEINRMRHPHKYNINGLQHDVVARRALKKEGKVFLKKKRKERVFKFKEPYHPKVNGERTKSKGKLHVKPLPLTWFNDTSISKARDLESIKINASIHKSLLPLVNEMALIKSPL